MTDTFKILFEILYTRGQLCDAVKNKQNADRSHLIDHLVQLWARGAQSYCAVIRVAKGAGWGTVASALGWTHGKLKDDIALRFI